MKQAIQPLTDAWQRLPIEPRRSTLLGIRFRSPQVGLYHMDRTRRPKPLTRPGWPLSQKRSRRRERKATKRWRKQDRRDGLHPAKWPIFVRILALSQRWEQERLYYEKALAAYERALQQNNADATAYQGKGNALVGLERYDEALTAFEQALALTPLPTTYVHVGNVLTTLGRCDEAVTAYEQALALDASYVSAYAGMSEALWQLGRTQEAEQAEEKAMQFGYDD